MKLNIGRVISRSQCMVTNTTKCLTSPSLQIISHNNRHQFSTTTSTSSQLQYQDQVAVVTGAGGGLGRAYALLLASRGCKVVVNDLGSGKDGAGADARAADLVVKEIEANGGEAVANYD